MKKIRNAIVGMLAVGLIFTSVTVQAALEENECEACMVSSDQVVSSEVDDEGNLITVLDNGTEIIYYENGDIILNDYGHVFGDYNNVDTKTRSGWIKLGKAIWEALGICSAIEYVTGHDYCRIVLEALGDKLIFGQYYVVSGNFVPGYIPGCEPRNSAPCNAGYWQYSVTKE